MPQCPAPTSAFLRFTRTNIELISIKFGESGHYRSLLVTTVHYQSLPVTTGHYRSLPVTTGHYWSLLFTTSHCRSLPVTTVHYQSLPVTTGHYWSLLFTTSHCRSLPTDELITFWAKLYYGQATEHSNRRQSGAHELESPIDARFKQLRALRT